MAEFSPFPVVLKGDPPLRKIVPAAGTALALTLMLTACGGAEIDSVELSKDPSEGTAPSVSFETPLQVSEAETKVLREGEGEDLAEGDNVLLQAALFKGSDGSSLGDTYSQGAGQVLKLDDELKEAIPQMYDALLDAKEGAIIAYSSPDTSGAAGDESTSVEVYQVAKKILAPLNQDMSDTSEKMPTVTQDDQGTPTIEKPSGDEPKDLQTEVLIEGDGEEVSDTATVVANYVGVRWADGEVFDSSYDTDTPASFPLDNVIEGWKEGLKGQKVGSRVLLVVPTDQAYGTEDQLGEDSEYPAGSLVFVVDILGAVPTPEPAPSESATPSESASSQPSEEASAAASPTPAASASDQ